MEVEHIKLRIYSQQVFSQIRGETHAKDLLLQRYLKLATKKLARSKAFEIAHVLREENTYVHVLSQLDSTGSLWINHSFV